MHPPHTLPQPYPCLQVELDRLEEDHARERRIRRREKQIAETHSPIQRALLQAKQFLDENS